MDFKEPTRGSESLGGQSHLRNKPPVAPCLAVSTTGTLHAVGAIHYHFGHYLQHIGYVTEIYNEVIVAECVASLGEPHVSGTRFPGLFHGIAHVFPAEKLCLLDVYRLASPGSCHKQVGLPAQESRYLHHVNHFSCGLGLPTFVYVCEQFQPVLCLYIGQHLQPFVYSGTSERRYGGAVGLVKRGFEDYICAQFVVYPYYFLGHGVE